MRIFFNSSTDCKKELVTEHNVKIDSEPGLIQAWRLSDAEYT